MSEDLGYSKILITGADGQLGRALIKRLLDYNISMIALDRIAVTFEDDRIESMTMDLTNIDSTAEVENSLKDVDYLIHLASIVTDSTDVIKDAKKSVKTEILGTLTLLNRLPNLKGITFSSSYMVYGPAVYLPVDEKHPTEPVNIFGICKLAAENFLRLYGMKENIPVLNLRFAGIYGPGTHIYSGRLIASLIRDVGEDRPPQIFGKGDEHRAALYMDDAVEAIIKSIKKSKDNISGTFNISAGEHYTASEVAEMVIEIFAKPELRPEYKAGPVSPGSALTDMDFDITKARNILGYKPQFNLKEGLGKHIEWFKQQQEPS